MKKDRLDILVEATKEAIKQIDKKEEKDILRWHLEFIYFMMK